MTKIESARQKKIFALCEVALSYEPQQRGVFIDAECAEDLNLKKAVLALLNGIDESSEFPSLSPQEPEYVADDRIADYRVVRKLGMGGMGGVYLAERDTAGFTQRVALKVMRTFLRSDDMVARFNEERKILARLNHPYIARLIDGGTTEQGLPYLVMELVEGVPIDEFCDAQRLTVSERLQLVQKLALAIQSAHQNLVVHSDLKPSNILVTQDRIPKLLDFGIAKLLRKVPTSDPHKKASMDSLALTPDYASPEQISGEEVTTASDIYSLGVLTYNLLVGETPYQISSISRAELATTVDNVDIVRPSTLVASAKHSVEMTAVATSRRTNPSHLARHLSGDIDAVLAKALAKNPAERYTSSSAFADDLMRCVKKLPVAAQSDSLNYRLRKFIARNLITVTASSITILALITGLGISLWQAHIANKRFDDLHGFAEMVIFDLHDEIAVLPGATAARQLLTQQALHYLDQLAKDAAGDQDLQLNLSKAYKRMGDVLGNPNNANLGEVESALESYQKALAIAKSMSDGVGSDDRIERHKAIVFEKIADVLAWQRDTDAALKNSEMSLALFQSLAAKAPNDLKAVMSVAISLVKRGDLLGHPNFPNAGKPVQSLEQYQKALAAIEPIAKRADAPAGAMRYLALVHERLGTILSIQGNYSIALPHLETSLSIRKQLDTGQSTQADSRRDVAIAFEKIADVQLARGEAHLSLAYYEQALAIYRSLVTADPKNTNALRTLAIGLENLGDALIAANQREVALARYHELLSIRQDLVERNPTDARLVSELRQVAARIDKL